MTLSQRAGGVARRRVACVVRTTHLPASASASARHAPRQGQLSLLRDDVIIVMLLLLLPPLIITMMLPALFTYYCVYPVIGCSRVDADA